MIQSMRSRVRSGILLAVSTLALPLILGAASPKPNILLIMADDVGSDAIGCYGGQSHPTTHIDKLAGGGMKFHHGYAQPVCHPSRICLMTGRYPVRFGKTGQKWGDYPDAAEGHSIGDRMKAGGYATAVAGKWQLCMMKNDLEHPRRTGFDEWMLFGWHEGGRFHDPLLYHNGKLRTDTKGKYGPDLYTAFLIDFMERNHKAGKPFFAYYPMALCHDVTDDLKGRHVAYATDGRWLTFAEMISSMDDMVGRLVAALDRMGARKNTLVIFTTDNGTPAASYLYVNEKGKMIRPKTFSIRDGKVVPGGKGKLDDTGTRVPFIANWPGRIQPGSETSAMVDLTDLLPTFTDLAGIKNDAMPRDGISFASVLFGKKRDRDRPWVYLDHRGRRCVRTHAWKLYDNGRMFDMKNDPAEKKPLASDAKKRQRAELQAVLNEMTAPERQ